MRWAGNIDPHLAQTLGGKDFSAPSLTTRETRTKRPCSLGLNLEPGTRKQCCGTEGGGWDMVGGVGDMVGGVGDPHPH